MRRWPHGPPANPEDTLPRGYFRVDTLKHPEGMAEWRVAEKPLIVGSAGRQYLGQWGSTIVASTMPFVLDAGIHVGKIAFPAGRHLFPPIGTFADLCYDPADNDPANVFKVLWAVPPEYHDEEYRKAVSRCLHYDYAFVIVTAAPAERSHDGDVLLALHGCLGWRPDPWRASRVTVFARPRLAREVQEGIKCLVVQSVALHILRTSPAFRAYWVAKEREQLVNPPRGLFFIREQDEDAAVDLMQDLLSDVDEDATYDVRDTFQATQYLQDGPELDAARAQWRAGFDSTITGLHDFTDGNVVFVPAAEHGAGACAGTVAVAALLYS